MKRMICVMGLACVSLGVAAQQNFPTSQQEDKDHIMSEAYWKIWNPERLSSMTPPGSLRFGIIPPLPGICGRKPWNCAAAPKWT